VRRSSPSSQGSRLVTDCPSYSPDARESDAIKELRAADPLGVPERAEEADPVWTLEKLLSAPTIASKSWAYRQYDSTVRTNTVIGPGGDAAVLRIRGTNKAIAVKTDCNGRYVYLDPRVGGRIAVAEAARNVACTGARPMAITNCLNFGNPTRPEVFYQFREAVAGMGEACRALGTPVTGGNVSLYNESPSGAVYPTPVIGMVGLIDDLSYITRATFQHDGDAVLLLGEMRGELGGSEYLATIHGRRPRRASPVRPRSRKEGDRFPARGDSRGCSQLRARLQRRRIGDRARRMLRGKSGVPERCGNRSLGMGKHSESRGSIRGDSRAAL